MECRAKILTFNCKLYSQYLKVKRERLTMLDKVTKAVNVIALARSTLHFIELILKFILQYRQKYFALRYYFGHSGARSTYNKTCISR